MLGMVVKFGIISAIVASIGGFVYLRRGSLPQVPSPDRWLAIASESAQQVDFKVLAKNTSDALDSLVNPDKNSPVVLGVKITNESLGKVVDVLQGLPPDQLDQLKQAICTSTE